MTIRALAKLPKLEDMDVSITITMTVAEWREQMRQLDSLKQPSWTVGKLIASALGYVSKMSGAEFSPAVHERPE